MVEQTPKVEFKNFQLLAQLRKQLTADQQKYILDNIVPGLNPGEMFQFLYKAHLLGLDPLNGEISAHVRSDEQGNRRLITIIHKQGKARKAFEKELVEAVEVEDIWVKKDKDNETKRVEPWEGGMLWGAKAVIQRKEYHQPFVVTAALNEYDTGKSIWKSKKATMIRKVALSQCYDLAFPDLFVEIYEEGEVEDVEPTLVNQSEAQIPRAGDAASPSQIKTIEKLGGVVKPDMTVLMASQEIKRLTQERQA